MARTQGRYNPVPYDPRDLFLNNFTTKDKRDGTLAGGLGATSTLKGTGSGTVRSSTAQHASAGSTVKSARVWQSLESEVNPSLRPPFLDALGKWQANKLPDMVVDSQAQPLTAPGVFTATGTLRGSQLAEGPKAIANVYTYNDVSPAVHTECAHDARGWAGETNKTWDPTVQKLRTARHYAPEDVLSSRVSLGQGDAAMLSSSFQRSQTHLLRPTTTTPTTDSLSRTGRIPNTIRDPPAPGGEESAAARGTSISQFWQRVGGGGKWTLGCPDIVRTMDDLSTRAVPASHNTRLVGSRWRYVERPTVGQSLYTDYYGPCNKDNGNYYGRSWHHVPQ